MNAKIDSVLKKLQSPAKLIVICTFLTAAGFAFIAAIAGFGNRFFSIIGGLITMVIMVAFWASVPTLILLKKENLAKKVFPFILFYWFLNEMINLLSTTDWIRPNIPGLFVAIGVFEFLIALAFLTAIVFIVLGKVKKIDRFDQLPTLIIAGTFLFFIVVFALRVAVEVKYKADWGDYLETIVSTLILPVGFFFAVLYFFPPKKVASENAQEKVAMEETPAQEEKEENAKEETAEEVPAAGAEQGNHEDNA